MKCYHYDVERFDMGKINERVFECVHCKRVISKNLGKNKRKK